MLSHFLKARIDVRKFVHCTVKRFINVLKLLAFCLYRISFDVLVTSGFRGGGHFKIKLK